MFTQDSGNVQGSFKELLFESLCSSTNFEAKEINEISQKSQKELKDKTSKDVLFSLSFQSPKKTLEDKDVNSIITEIINIVSKKFNAKLRDNQRYIWNQIKNQ